MKPRRVKVAVEERLTEEGWATYLEGAPAEGELVRVWIYPQIGRSRVGKLVKMRIGPCWQFEGQVPLPVVDQDKWKEIR